MIFYIGTGSDVCVYRSSLNIDYIHGWITFLVLVYFFVSGDSHHLFFYPKPFLFFGWWREEHNLYHNTVGLDRITIYICLISFHRLLILSSLEKREREKKDKHQVLLRLIYIYIYIYIYITTTRVCTSTNGSTGVLLF